MIYKESKKSSFTRRVDDCFAVLLSLFIAMCKESEVFQVRTGSLTSEVVCSFEGWNGDVMLSNVFSIIKWACYFQEGEHIFSSEKSEWIKNICISCNLVGIRLCCNTRSFFSPLNTLPGMWSAFFSIHKRNKMLKFPLRHLFRADDLECHRSECFTSQYNSPMMAKMRPLTAGVGE